MTARRITFTEVLEDTLVARINRRLELQEQKLRRTHWYRDEFGIKRANADAGRYFIFDVRRRLVCKTFVDIEALARELGVLSTWERLAPASPTGDLSATARQQRESAERGENERGELSDKRE